MHKGRFYVFLFTICYGKIPVLSPIPYMIKDEFFKIVTKNKTMIINEAQKLDGFMRLLMKPKNTRTKWTKEEKRQLKLHLKHLSYYVPALVIFVLPFGSLLIPLLAEILDRRRTHRLREHKGLS